MDIQFPDFSGSLFTYYKEGVKMYSLDLHNAVKMSYKKKCFFSFSECEFHLMRSFSCHTDRINRGMTVPILHKRFLPTQIYILYFSEHQKKMNEVQVEEERSYFYTFIDITMIILCYIPLNLKILRPWISHYFSNVISLCVIIMILATSFICNNFVWCIFTTCLTLHYKFWIWWIGKKKKYTLKIDIIGIALSITTQLIIFLKVWQVFTRFLTNLSYS